MIDFGSDFTGESTLHQLREAMTEPSYVPAYLNRRKRMKLERRFSRERFERYEEFRRKGMTRACDPFQPQKTHLERLANWLDPKLEKAGDIVDAATVCVRFRLDCAMHGLIKASEEVTARTRRAIRYDKYKHDILLKSTLNEDAGKHILIQTPPPPMTVSEEAVHVTKGFVRGLMRPSLDYFKPQP